MGNWGLKLYNMKKAKTVYFFGTGTVASGVWAVPSWRSVISEQARLNRMTHWISTFRTQLVANMPLMSSATAR